MIITVLILRHKKISEYSDPYITKTVEGATQSDRGREKRAGRVCKDLDAEFVHVSETYFFLIDWMF